MTDSVIYEDVLSRESKIYSRVKRNFRIRIEEVVLQRNMILVEGVTITIDDGGELHIL